MDKILITFKTMKVLKALIDHKEQGNHIVRIYDLRKEMGSNIHDAVYILQSHGCICITKDKGFTFAEVLIDRNCIDRFIAGYDKNYNSSNLSPKMKKSPPVKICPYHGRKYEDVPKGTFDAAIHNNVTPSKQYRTSHHGSSAGMINDA
ncbi:MAG: hypothetical protein JKY93_01015 [Gammaproteobacteria bacterium]|nr:hypothetical protein [Gammaproteobacteria bacterium]